MKRSKGCAHRFRPTYAGTNMGHPSDSLPTLLSQTEEPSNSDVGQAEPQTYGTLPRISTLLATNPGCPTSRSFFARCGILLPSTRKHSAHDQHLRSRSVVSHISRKTSEMWGTRGFVANKVEIRGSVVERSAVFSSSAVRIRSPSRPNPGRARQPGTANCPIRETRRHGWRFAAPTAWPGKRCPCRRCPA